MKENNIEYKINDKNIDVDSYIEFVNKIWKRNYNKDMVKIALTNTINITAWDEEKLIGSVRILTDGYFFGTIPEILVLPEYQKKGIGRKLMELAWENSPTSLYFGAQNGNEEFYEKLGFKKGMQSYEKRKPRIE